MSRSSTSEQPTVMESLRRRVTRSKVEDSANDPVMRAEQYRGRATTLRTEYRSHTRKAIVKVATLRAQTDGIESDLQALGERVDVETDRLGRAADALDQAAACDQSLPDLRGEVLRLDAEVAGARGDMETVTARRDELVRSIDEATVAEVSEDTASAVGARARRIAAQGLLAETEGALTKAADRLAEVERRHELAVASVHALELERDALVRLAEDVLSGAEDARHVAEAEEEARRVAEADARRSQQIAYEMLGGAVGQATREALARASKEESERAGWFGLVAPPARGGRA